MELFNGIKRKKIPEMEAVMPKNMCARNLADMNLAVMAPSKKPADRDEKKIVNSVSGMVYFWERKGIVGPMAASMNPKNKKFRE